MKFKIEYLVGEKVLAPIHYKLYKNEKGYGVLESEFVRITGDYEDLLAQVPMLSNTTIEFC